MVAAVQRRLGTRVLPCRSRRGYWTANPRRHRGF